MLEIFISYCLQHGMTLASSIRKTNKKNVKFETLVRMHARSCQISSEVLELLKGGYADGAYARWRSLYELSVCARFLSDNEPELSQRFLDHSIIDSYEEALEFQKNCRKLGYRPFSRKYMENLEEKRATLVSKYGNDFIKPYGWAAPYLEQKKRNFKGMEETVSFGYMRSHYKSANNSVHSGAKGFLFKHGTVRQNKIMLAGPSNYGLADPAQNTAYSLFQSTLSLLGFEFYLEDTLFISVGEKLVRELSEEFVRIQKEIESEEKAK